MDEKNDRGARILILAAGLAGMSGVMAAAASSHGGESRNLAALAAICLAHGPVLLALGLLGRGKLLQIAGLILAGGTLVFAADLGVREWMGQGLFPGAAPLGGGVMILGWLTIAVAGAWGLKQSN
ncbi:DUF423 domain-containing protein [Devosia alba]|uniref:DUF423 domain-containing protein n=1 Tax=Devosia alba TaxID=3152360 RepID=UPI003265204A